MDDRGVARKVESCGAWWGQGEVFVLLDVDHGMEVIVAGAQGFPETHRGVGTGLCPLWTVVDVWRHRGRDRGQVWGQDLGGRRPGVGGEVGWLAAVAAAVVAPLPPQSGHGHGAVYYE